MDDTGNTSKPQDKSAEDSNTTSATTKFILEAFGGPGVTLAGGAAKLVTDKQFQDESEKLEKAVVKLGTDHMAGQAKAFKAEAEGISHIVDVAVAKAPQAVEGSLDVAKGVAKNAILPGLGTKDIIKGATGVNKAVTDTGKEALKTGKETLDKQVEIAKEQAQKLSDNGQAAGQAALDTAKAAKPIVLDTADKAAQKASPLYGILKKVLK